MDAVLFCLRSPNAEPPPSRPCGSDGIARTQQTTSHTFPRDPVVTSPTSATKKGTASGLAVTPSEIEQYGKVTVKFRLDSWDRNMPDEDNINGRQHIQSGKYFRYQKDVQALKTTAGAAAGVAEVARVAGVSLVGVLSGLGYTLLKRKKLF